MELRVLGAHNAESKETRMESHLIDGVLVLDAGGLTRSLNFDEQLGIKAVVLSHRHFDHVRDLLPLGLNLRNTGLSVDVYGIADTIKFVTEKLLDGSLYPDFLSYPSPENPVFRLHRVEFYQDFQVLDYTLKAVPVPHAVPAAGFLISSGESNFFYTGDTGEGLSGAWDHVSPDTLLTEVTFGSEEVERAAAAGHLTPRLFEEAMTVFQSRHGFLPRVIVAHMSPPFEATIRKELKEVGQRLGIDILIAGADTRVQV